jgi:hypothetical protein
LSFRWVASIIEHPNNPTKLRISLEIFLTCTLGYYKASAAAAAAAAASTHAHPRISRPRHPSTQAANLAELLAIHQKEALKNSHSPMRASIFRLWSRAFEARHKNGFSAYSVALSFRPRSHYRPYGKNHRARASPLFFNLGDVAECGVALSRGPQELKVSNG